MTERKETEDPRKDAEDEPGEAGKGRESDATPEAVDEEEATGGGGVEGRDKDG